MSSTHRLLYRGALSLPDSHLLLDGLTFFAPASGTSINLLQNPLALALESMRGRPSLSFIRVEKLQDLSLDPSGDIQMDIHPDAVLSNIYFESTFCMVTGESISTEGRREVGVRVSLGDATSYASTSSTSPCSTEMVIYARPSPTSSQAPSSSITLQLYVARIMPYQPPPSGVRLPRPDDPTPRRPPLLFGKSTRKRARPRDNDSRMASLTNMDKGKGKQAKPPAILDVSIPIGTRVGKGKASDLARLGSGVRLGHDPVFKVPAVPANRNSASVSTRGSILAEHATTSHAGVEEIEKANKTLIKKVAVVQLASLGISKTHPEFTDLYGHVYRGAAFALRTRAPTKPSHLDRRMVEHMVETHVNMYVREGIETSKGESMVS